MSASPIPTAILHWELRILNSEKAEKKMEHWWWEVKLADGFPGNFVCAPGWLRGQSRVTPGLGGQSMDGSSTEELELMTHGGLSQLGIICEMFCPLVWNSD